ncbi:MAG: DUF4149 domain-containing protein [Nitrospinota bacterium]
MSTLAKVLHLLSVSLWVGSVAFASFVATPVIFRILPRPQAGDVVAAIFPTYYWVGHVCGAVALVTLLVAVGLAGGWTLRTGAVGALLVFMLAANLYAGFVVQPQVHQARAELRALPSGPATAPPAQLKAAFNRLHARSVQLNAVVLVGGLLVLVFSAARLEV